MDIFNLNNEGMKNIVCIDSCMISGGAEHQLSVLMDMLAEKGYNLTYVTFVDIVDHYKINEKIKRVRLAQNKSKIVKILSIFFYLLFVKTDVVIAYSQRLSVLSLFPLLFRPNVKVISSERNYTINAPDIYEKILMRTGVYKRATFIVPNNYSQTKYLAKKMPSIKKKLRTITNFTDIDKYKFVPPHHNDICRIGIFCRVEYQKNFHRFIEAIRILKDKKEFAFHVDWYGLHTFKNQNQIIYYEKGLEMINRYNLESLITIHDPSTQVEKLLPSYDVLCLPSLFEGFSNSISEYICCGRPVLCSDISDNSVMVYHGENGFLFDPLNVESIVEAFDTFFGLSDDDKDRMCKKSREIACSLFDKSKFINSYIELIG